MGSSSFEGGGFVFVDRRESTGGGSSFFGLALDPLDQGLSLVQALSLTLVQGQGQAPSLKGRRCQRFK